MTNQLTRRAVLASAPCLAAAPAVALPALDTHATPILRLYREWEAALGHANGRDISEDECNARFDRMAEIEEEIVAMPSTCAADLAAKIASYTNFGSFGLPEQREAEWAELFWAEVKGLLSAEGKA